MPDTPLDTAPARTAIARLRLRVIGRLTGLDRARKQVVMMALDALLLFVAAWAAYALRLGIAFVPNTAQAALMLTAPALTIPILARVGLYRSIIRFINERALWKSLQGIATATLLWAALAFLTQFTGLSGLPRSVPLIYGALAFLFIAGSRSAMRWFLLVSGRPRGKSVLIYGAGESGRLLAEALRQGRRLVPVAFLDDSSRLHGCDIAGLHIYPPQELGRLIEYYAVQEIIITVASGAAGAIRDVLTEHHPQLRVRILQPLIHFADHKHIAEQVREADISDLLGREAIAPDRALLGQSITGKVVLVTGAGGSIGSELCRQIATLAPAKLVLLEQNEYALYKITHEMQRRELCPTVSLLGSVCNRNLVEQTLREHGVETIYHAAAHKHVHLAETNPLEYIHSNVFGTLTIARAALKAGVRTFVLISTDKAVSPSNVMGATKRVCELIACAFAHKSQAQPGTTFCSVRFGNVLGSSGSVVPLFREQIHQGGPVTVTHPEVTRYFMSIHEAVQLVIQAGNLARGGETFLLDMGEPVAIIELARNMIRLMGRSERTENQPDGDIEIVFTGLRPGEKLHEALYHPDGATHPTAHPKIMRVDEPSTTDTNLLDLLAQLERMVEVRNARSAQELLYLMTAPTATTALPRRDVKLGPRWAEY